MISFLILILFTLVGLLLAKPIIPLLRLKLIYGSSVHLYYFPFFGIFRFMRQVRSGQDHVKYFRELVQRNPEHKLIASHIGCTPYIEVFDPLHFKQLVQDHQKFDHYELISDRRLMSKGMLFQNGKQWRLLRNLLSPSFHFEELKRRVPLLNTIYRDRVKNLNLEKPIDGLQFGSQISGDVIIQTFFGQQLPLINGKEPQIEIISIFSQFGWLLRNDNWHQLKWLILRDKTWSFWLSKQEKQLYDRSTALIQLSVDVIDARINLKKEQLNKGLQLSTEDFLDIHVNELLKPEPILTKDDIVQQFITFFFAGTDTTGTFIATALYFFGAYPEIQKTIRNEVKSNLGERNFIEFADLSSLIQLNAFLLECLRLRTPAQGLLMRQCNQDCFIGDIPIKKGWYLAYKFLSAHSNPKYFENPNEFNHKRFLDNAGDLNQVFTPFSAGARNCIGQHLAMMEAKIVLALILNEFEIKLTTKDVSWQSTFLYQYSPQDIIILTRI